MTFRTFLAQVEGCLRDALDRSQYPADELAVEEPSQGRYGEATASIAFHLAKTLESRPRDVALRIFANLSTRGRPLIHSSKVEGAGYLNFYADYPTLAFETMTRMAADPAYGSVDLGRGRRVIVEHTSVNPNKALHVGHLRNVFLGDSTSRILSFTNHDVRVLNYIDDSGLQVADLLVGFTKLGISEDPKEGMKYDQYCGDVVYVEVNRLYEEMPELKDNQKSILRDLEDPKSPAYAMARRVTQRILKEQLHTCWRAGARYDLLVFESHILESGLWEEFFKKLTEEGIAWRAESGELAGCWLVGVPGEDGDKVLVRSDGTATYIAKDIPFAAWKLGLVNDPFLYVRYPGQPDRELWRTSMDQWEKQKGAFDPADLVINVIDVRQARLQKTIGEILDQLGVDSAARYRHLAYEVVALSSETASRMGAEGEGPVQMSGRRGIYMNGDEVLDALKLKALEETRKRNPSRDQAWIERIAELVSLAAIRYQLLRQDLDKMVVFDIESSLRLDGDTGSYIQYAHARASRILEKAKVPTEFGTDYFEGLTSPYERRLILLASKMDLAVEQAARHLAPKVVAKYSMDFSTSFNQFYEHCPVLGEEDERLRFGRILLTHMFKVAVGNSLELLGIASPGEI